MPRLFKKEINFLGNRRIFFIISVVMIVIAIAAIGIRGLNFGIEFVGGTSISFNDSGDISIEQMRTAFDNAGVDQPIIQTSDTGDSHGFIVRTATIDPDVAAGYATVVATELGLSADSYDVTTIGPGWGADITRTSAIAFLVAIAAIIAYIAIRFEYKMGITAIISLIHDLIIIVGIYALVGRELTPNVVAALLTIMGYSLYDTVVVFHRINDNLETTVDHSFMTMANHSINQVFTRTINTTLTSLIPVLAMLFFGGETLKDFAFAMSIGLVLGSYSSIGIAAPLYAMWKQREPKYAKLLKKYGEGMGDFSNEQLPGAK